ARTRRSPQARRYVELALRNQTEMRQLAASRARIVATFRRWGGPSLVGSLGRFAREPGYRVPEELGGLPFTQCVHQLAAAIHRYGSPALRADLDELEEMVTGLVGQELTALIGQVED